MNQIKLITFETDFTNQIEEKLKSQPHYNSNQHDHEFCTYCELSYIPVQIIIHNNIMVITFANGHCIQFKIDVINKKHIFHNLEMKHDNFADQNVYRDYIPIEFDQDMNIIKEFVIEKKWNQNVLYLYDDNVLYIIDNKVKKKIITLKNCRIIGTICYSQFHNSIFLLCDMNSTDLLLIEIDIGHLTTSIVKLDNSFEYYFNDVKRVCAIPGQDVVIIATMSNILWIDIHTGLILHNKNFTYENPTVVLSVEEFVDISCTTDKLYVLTKCLDDKNFISEYVFYYDIRTYNLIGYESVCFNYNSTLGYLPSYDMVVLFSLKPDHITFFYNKPEVSKEDILNLIIDRTKLNIDIAEIISEYTHGTFDF